MSKYPFLDTPPPDHIVVMAERYRAFQEAMGRELKRLPISEVKEFLANHQRQFNKCRGLAKTTGYCPGTIHYHEMMIHVITAYLESRGVAAALARANVFQEKEVFSCSTPDRN